MTVPMGPPDAGKHHVDSESGIFTFRAGKIRDFSEGEILDFTILELEYVERPQPRDLGRILQVWRGFQFSFLKFIKFGDTSKSKFDILKKCFEFGDAPKFDVLKFFRVWRHSQVQVRYLEVFRVWRHSQVRYQL